MSKFNPLEKRCKNCGDVFYGENDLCDNCQEELPNEYPVHDKCGLPVELCRCHNADVVYDEKTGKYIDRRDKR